MELLSQLKRIEMEGSMIEQTKNKSNSIKQETFRVSNTKSKRVTQRYAKS